MFFNKTFKLTFLFIFLAELLSLCGYLLPDFNKIGFFIIVITALILSLYKLEYGLYIVLAELFIGSKGYLFAYSYDGLEISLRVALWLAVMAVWLAVFITTTIKTRRLPVYLSKKFILNSFWPFFLILFVFIGWGLVNGFLKGNSFNNIFFDFNGWLYFALIFPIYEVVFARASAARESNFLKNIFRIFMAAAAWLSLKSLCLLYIFSHNLTGMIEEVYRWVRVTGVGEITLVQGGFYRIFFQSHIFILIAFFVIYSLIIYQTRKSRAYFTKDVILLYAIFTILLTVNIISFSRSNWVGLAFGLILFIIYIFIHYNWRKSLPALLLFILAGAASLLITIAIVKFPYPDPLGGFSTTSLLTRRASPLIEEAGLSSRWALFPLVWSEIKAKAILGQGFGATVTYISSDPRVLEQNLTGEYTTYAFEWGWLDIWLKLGIFGLLIYIALIFKIIIIGLAKNNSLADKNAIIYHGFAIGLGALAATSFFSPYLNHPLGIGYILLVSVMIDKNIGTHNLELYI